MQDESVNLPLAKQVDTEAKSRLVHQLLRSLWLPNELDEAERAKRVRGAIELLGEIEPRDAQERMLSVQMIATHEAAMECLRRAMLASQTFEGRDMALRHATKLMGIYERQLAALDKRRGRGQQNVTVKHVHVGQGGQAIVGNVSHAAPEQVARADDPAALAAPVEQPADILTPTEPAAKAAVASGDAATKAPPPARSRRRRTR